MYLEVGRNQHDGRFLTVFRGHSHHLGKDAILTSSTSAIVEHLVSAIFLRRVARALAIAIIEDNLARNASIINAWFAVGLWQEWLKTRRLRVRPLERTRHFHRSFLSRHSCQRSKTNGS